MAYQALYRSYRPTTFHEVVGQLHVIKTLKNAVMENKSSHAYIFSGLRGIGKTTIARILAKAVNCEHPIDGEPCNTCTSCLAVMNDETMDIVELDAASNNGVDEMRDILEKVNFLPSQLKKKVYIIDEVHMLSTAAFNALLKTLEEPPAYVMFILATTEPHKVPPTILSRCQRFDFKQLTAEEIKTMLLRVVEQENVKITEGALEGIAEAAEGGMRDALSILDQAIAYSGAQITLDDIDNITGRVSKYKLIALLEALQDKDAMRAITITNELLNLGKEVSNLIGGVIQFCRDILLYKSITDQTYHKYIYDIKEFQIIAQQLSEKQLFYYIDMFIDVQNKIRYTNSQKIYLEVGIMKIVTSAAYDIEVLDKIQNLEEKLAMIPLAANAVLNGDAHKLAEMDGALKRMVTEMETLRLADFKDKVITKINRLEETISKIVVLPESFTVKLQQLELDITNVKQSLQVHLASFQALETKVMEVENGITIEPQPVIDFSQLQLQMNALETRLQQTEGSELLQTIQPSAMVEEPAMQRMNVLEDRIQQLNEQKIYNKEQEIRFNKDMEQLKENYFALAGQMDKIMAEQALPLAAVVDLEGKFQHLEQIIVQCNQQYQVIQEKIKPLEVDAKAVIIEQRGSSHPAETAKGINYERTLSQSAVQQNEPMIETEVKQVLEATHHIEQPNEPVHKKQTIVKVVGETEVHRSDNTVVIRRNRPESDEPVTAVDDTAKIYDVRIVERILHQAREQKCREEKVRLLANWPKLQDKVGNLLAPTAKLLADGKFTANGETELLLIYPSAAICNHLMEAKTHSDAKQILRITFGKEYDFMALPENTWQDKRLEYTGQYGMGVKIPKLSPIVNPELKVVSTTKDMYMNYKNRPIQKAEALFGEDLVEKEEEDD